MTLWGQCPKCHHALEARVYYRPQGIQQSENCFACGWEEVLAVREAGRAGWQRPDHTPLPDPEVGVRQVGGKRHQRSKVGVVL